MGIVYSYGPDGIFSGETNVKDGTFPLGTTPIKPPEDITEGKVWKYINNEWVESDRPTPPLSYQEIPDVVGIAKENLKEIDLKSIRSIREMLVKDPNCSEYLKQYEEEAISERAKLIS